MRVRLVIQGYSDTREPGYLVNRSTGERLYIGGEKGHGYVERNGRRSYFEVDRRSGFDHWNVSFDDDIRFAVFQGLDDRTCAYKIFCLQDIIGGYISAGAGSDFVVEV